MSVRQYIGARYVTKIYENTLDPSSAEWQASVNYEPLTMVTYNNGSYLSKKQVPASVGNPADNPTYWVQTGFYNGQIAQLQNDLNNLQNIVEAINSPTIRNMDERKFVFIGDSYTQVPTPDTSFVGAVAQRLALTSDQYHNIGVSGDGVGGFINQVNGYSYSDNEEITDVVVTGGINDAQGLFANSQLPTQIPQLIQAIRVKFPNAIIWAGFSGGGYYTRLVGTYVGFTYDNVQNIKYYWEEYFTRSHDVIYMDKLDEWFRSVNDTDYFQGGSGLHPYQFGIDVLAEKICNYLKGGGSISPDLTNGSGCHIDLALSYSNWTDSTKKLYYERCGSLEYIRFAAAGVNLSSELTISTTPFNLIEQPNDNTTLVACMKKSRIGTPLFYTVTGDSTLKCIMANFVIDDTKIKVQCPTAIVPIEHVNSIWYPALEFVLPANAV